jgi:ABC-type sugar transport system ATPase subunit
MTLFTSDSLVVQLYTTVFTMPFLCLPTFALQKNWPKKKLVNMAYNKNSSAHWIQKLRIKTPSPYTPTASLSGGNQQKVVLAKWMEVNPKVLIMVDPTRGIDVGSKTEIYQLPGEFCKQGISIIMITSEMPELLAMSDRILVMYQGRVNGEFSRNEADQIKVVSVAIGGNI